jgi:hypothetical protein
VNHPSRVTAPVSSPPNGPWNFSAGSAIKTPFRRPWNSCVGSPSMLASWNCP